MAPGSIAREQAYNTEGCTRVECWKAGPTDAGDVHAVLQVEFTSLKVLEAAYKLHGTPSCSKFPRTRPAPTPHPHLTARIA